MSREPQQPTPEASPPELIWKDEMNLCELPLSTLSDRVSETVTKLEFCITESDGETTRRIRIIPPGDDQLRELVEVAYPGLIPSTGSPPRRRKGEPETSVELAPKVVKLLSSVRGVPNPMDEDVLLALIQLTRKDGFSNRRVHFSLYEIVKLLGWNEGVKSYTRVIVSLLRWKAVLLTYQDSWRDNEEKRFMTRTFNMLDEVTIYTSPGRRSRSSASGQSQLPFSSFLWSEAMFKSFEDGFLKDLDFRKYKGLNSRIAKRMYRFLDKCFGRLKTPSVSFDLRDFACGHIGLSRDYEPWKLKQVLAPALQELEESGVIMPMSSEKRYQSANRSKIRIVFHPVKASLSSERLNTSEAVSPLTMALEQNGVTRSTAESVVAEFSPEQIQCQLDVLAWWQQTGREPKIKEPGAWLCKAIRDGYAKPKDYESKAERDRKAKAVEDAKAKLQQEAADKRRQGREEKAARQALRDHVRSYLESLAVEERQALEERAVAAGETWQQDCVRQKAPGHGTIRQMLIDQEVMRVCPMA